MTKRKLKYRIAEKLGYYLFRKHKNKGPFLTAVHQVISMANRFDVDGILDVGAHKGETGSCLRRFGYKGWIFSFEPNPQCFAVLSELSSRDKKWKVYPYALDKEDGEKIFYASSNTTLGSFHRPSSEGEDYFSEEIAHSTEIKVQTRRLDGLLPSLLQETSCQRVILKMDTQGNDINVIEGAGSYMKSVVGVLSEISILPFYRDIPNYLSTLSHFEKLDFLPSGFYPVGWHKNGQVSHEMDLVCINRKYLDA